MIGKIKKIASSPIKKNMAVNAFGFVIHTCDQILLVPLYLLCWGVTIYGDWILMSAFTVVFALSDAGLSSVTQSQFVIEYNKKKYNTCNSLLTNNLLLIIIVFLFVLLGFVLISILCNVDKLLGLHVVRSWEATYVILLLLCGVFVRMIRDVYESIFRALSLTYRGLLIKQMNMFCNVLVVSLILLTTKSMKQLVTLMLFSDLCFLLIMVCCSHSLYVFFPKKKYLNWRLFKQMLIPSISFMSYPISNTIIFQGFTYIANYLFGVQVMVLYNTTRTVTSMVKKVTTMIQESVKPEISVAFGQGDVLRMKCINRETYSLSMIVTMFLCLFLMIFGRDIYILWTHGQISFNYSLAFAFCVLVFCRNIWDSSNTVVIATNNHMKYSFYYLLGTITAVIFSLGTAHYYCNINVLVYSQLFIEIISCPLIIKKAMDLTSDHYSEYVLSPVITFVDKFKRMSDK